MSLNQGNSKSIRKFHEWFEIYLSKFSFSRNSFPLLRTTKKLIRGNKNPKNNGLSQKFNTEYQEIKQRAFGIFYLCKQKSMAELGITTCVYLLPNTGNYAQTLALTTMPSAKFIFSVKKSSFLSGFTLLCAMAIFDLINNLADFLTDLTELYGPINYHNTPIFCDIFIVTKGLCIKSGSLLVLSMSAERFFAVFYPIGYREKVSFGLLVKISIACAGISLLSTSLMSATHANTNGLCYEQRPGVTPLLMFLVVLESVVFQLAIPTILTIALNAAIVVKMKRRDSANQR